MGKADCGHHKDKRRRKIIKRILIGTAIFIFIVGLTVLIVWAVLKPTKPSFVLQDATVFGFNLTAPNVLTSTFQVTILSRNRNDRIGIYYDRLLVFATYMDQQITLPTAIPPTYQDTDSMNIWSPFVYGTSVPVAPYIGTSLHQDQAMGNVYLMVNMEGKVRWKVGTFTSGSYNLHVVCPAVIAFGNPDAGTSIGSNNAVKYSLSRSCSVSV